MVTHFHSTERFASRRALTGLAVIVCGCFVSAAGAQTTTGGIRGTVRDSTGGVLAGVTVEGSSDAGQPAGRPHVVVQHGELCAGDARRPVMAAGAGRSPRSERHRRLAE